MASVLALSVFFAVIALLLWGGWRTERRRAPGDGRPTLHEHAAADAGRVGAVATSGPHDAAAVGAPTHLDDVTRTQTRA